MAIENINAAMLNDFKELSQLNTANNPLPFSEQMLSEISSVNNKLNAAETVLQDLAAGKASNIHHVMLSLEDAKLSFQLLTQVRNKLLEGYQEILRMQI